MSVCLSVCLSVWGQLVILPISKFPKVTKGYPKVENICEYLSTQQQALDLHDEGGDGVQVVEEAGAAVGVSPHLDMVH